MGYKCKSAGHRVFFFRSHLAAHLLRVTPFLHRPCPYQPVSPVAARVVHRRCNKLWTSRCDLPPPPLPHHTRAVAMEHVLAIADRAPGWSLICNDDGHEHEYSISISMAWHGMAGNPNKAILLLLPTIRDACLLCIQQWQAPLSPSSEIDGLSLPRVSGIVG
ncbi:hypothetical protein LY76DRAFT_65564 [Colletotrichum caudatum]|nr:hypothetical protein LY76DRAFT_65564 [Colletotrichum caudatum]